MAQGSTSEVETELLIARRLGYVDEAVYKRLYDDTNTVARMIVGLMNHVKARI